MFASAKRPSAVDRPARLWYLPAPWPGEDVLPGRAPVYSHVTAAEDRPPARYDPEDLVIVQIFVRDNNVDQALKALKKKMQREGTFREMKRHVHYEKPSEKRARQKAEAVRRARKLARKRAQREGLIAAPKKPPGRP